MYFERGVQQGLLAWHCIDSSWWCEHPDYKKKVCHAYQARRCKYGSACFFAHCHPMHPDILTGVGVYGDPDEQAEQAAERKQRIPKAQQRELRRRTLHVHRILQSMHDAEREEEQRLLHMQKDMQRLALKYSD